MSAFCLFIDVRLLEYRGVEAQQLGVAPIGLGARSKPAQCVCQLRGWGTAADAARPISRALRDAVEAAGTRDIEDTVCQGQGSLSEPGAGG